MRSYYSKEMNEHAEEYRGAQISYDLENNHWRIQIAKSCLTPRKSLKLARAAVDNTFKKEVEFVQHEALLVDSCGVHLVRVTSYCDPEDCSRYSSSKQDVWIRRLNGDREKIEIDRIRENTPENRELVRLLECGQREINELQKLCYHHLESLSPYRQRTYPTKP